MAALPLVGFTSESSRPLWSTPCTPALSPSGQRFGFLLPGCNIQVSPAVTLIHAWIPQPLLTPWNTFWWFMGLFHPQPAPHQDVCVHSRLLGKHDVATWCSACLAVCVWMKSYFSAVSLAVLPPNYPISESFYNINLYTKLQCWCGGVPLYLGVCVRGSKEGLDSWAALALQGDSGGVNRSMVTQDGPTSTVKLSLEQTDIIWNSWGCRGPLGLVSACKKPAEKPTLQMHLCRRVYRTSRSIKLLRLVFKKALTCVL